MSEALRLHNQSRQQYNQALSSAWRANIQTFDPSLWLLRDPDAEEKMMRDADIGHAVGYRQKLIAGRNWNLTPRVESSPTAPLAVSIGTELLDGIRKFTDARLNLSSAFFSGQRLAWIHGEPRTMTIGDGKPRTWWVPRLLEDMDKRNFRIVPDRDEQTQDLSAHWERWNVGGARWEDLSRLDAVQLINHVYEDNQGTMGYGRALREALGWWWYAKTEVFQESLQAIERFAGGMLTAKVAGLRDADSALPNDEIYRQWLNKLEDMRGRHVIVMDKDDEIATVSTDGQGWQMLGEMRAELKNTIFTLVLGANLTTAANDGGSYALAEVQENSTEALIQFDRQALEETLTDSLIGCCWFKNHANLVELGIDDEKPRFTITQEKRQDPKERAEVANVLNAMGIDLSLDDLMEQTGFRKPEKGEDVIPGGAPQPMAQGPLPGFGFKGSE